MTDRIEHQTIICEGGLDSTENHLNLSANKPGSATYLINYEVGLTGGYRRVNGFAYFDEDFTGPTGEDEVLGIIIYKPTGAAEMIISARKRTGINEYRLYHYQAGVGWVHLSSAPTLAYTGGGETVVKLRYDVANDGELNYLVIVDGVNNATIFDGTTWDAMVSTNTGANMANAGGNQIVDAPSYVSFFQQALFLAGDYRNDAPGVVSYSAPNEFFKFTTAAGGGQALVGIDVVQIYPFRESLYVFGNNGIKKIIVDTDFVVRDVTKNIGCVASDSVVEVGGDVFFLAPDGYRPIAGTDRIGDVQLATISKPVHNLIKRLFSETGLVNVNSVVIRGKSQFRVFVGGDNYDQIDSRGIVAALRTADPLEGWEFGELRGFRCSCATSRYVGNTEYVLHGDYDGNVYMQESGSDFNGTDMFSYYRTPYLDFGDPTRRKTMRKVTIFFKGEGDLTVTLGVAYDWGSEDPSLNPSAYTFTVTDTPAVYDDPDIEYGDGTVYGGSLQSVDNTNIEGSCLSARFTFTSLGSDFPHTIHAIVIDYTTEGLR